jgi:hypothetical protein
MNEQPQQQPSTGLPAAELRTFLHSANAANAKPISEQDAVEQNLADEIKRTTEAAQAFRAAARRDAVIVVAREMQRRGQDLTSWTERDSEAAWEIAEILISLDSQEITSLDPTFR